MPSGSAVREFLSALGDRHTYSPRNDYSIFGFLWGLPVPVLSVGIDLWLTGRTLSASVLTGHPIHFFFLLHPFLFAVIFGAMGTVRHRKERRIEELVGQLKAHVVELESANARLKELDHLKAQFIANVTHELKTPLVAIRGYNESIVEGRFGPVNDKQRVGLGVAMRNVDRLQKLIEELLDFERVDSGEFRLDVSEFDLAPVIESALQSFQPQFEEKRISVERNLAPALPVRADRERISRVVMNLLSNAVKFSPAGRAIGIEAAAENGGVGVTVWDRGPGIPTAAQKFLFTRFYQAGRKTGGTGLGLAISKGIVEAHGGTIQVESTEGAGTRVRFTLPAEVPHEARTDRG